MQMAEIGAEIERHGPGSAAKNLGLGRLAPSGCLFADGAVDAFAQQIGVAEVAGVLLDQI